MSVLCPELLVYGIFVLVFVAVFRMFLYLGLRALLRRGYGANKVLILGCTESGKNIMEALKNAPEVGQRVVGFVDERYQVMDHRFCDIPVLGKYSDLPTLVKKLGISGIIIAHDSSSPQEIMRVLVWVCELPLHIYIVPELYPAVNGRFKGNLVHGFELQELFAFAMPPWQVQIKRFLDIVIAGFIGICSLPICLLAAIAIKLEDADAEIAPVPAGKVGHIVEPEMDLLSKIIMDFNDMFGNINWNDADNVQRQILAIPEMVSRDKKYQNAMKNSDAQEARTESERALQQVIFSIMADNMELFKQFQDNPSFKKWLSDLVFNLTYNPEGKEYFMPGTERKAVTYDYSSRPETLMVAEDPAPYGKKKKE